MARAGLGMMVDRLRRGLAARSADEELLDRFTAERDESAFAELVERHGPKVFAVCLRVLGHHHLAEDAYQATFLVLAKKAHSIQPRSAVGGFLYGVARRAALETYAVSCRRRETLVGSPPDSPQPASETIEHDVLALLDEEIANLSEPLRAAVVMCELDGVGRADAARQLGIAEGTLSSRLAAARKQLAGRLKQRGVVLSAGMMLALAESARAVVPPVLISETPGAIAIAGGVMKSLMLAKLKFATLGMLLLSMLGMSGFAPMSGSRAYAEPVPKSTPVEDRIFVAKLSHDQPDQLIEVMDAAGKSQGMLDVGKLMNVQRLRVSPDGRKLAFVRFIPLSGTDPNHKGKYAYPQDIYIVDLPLTGPPKEPTIKGVIDPSIAWSSDSQSLFVSRIPKDTNLDQNALQNKLIPKETILFYPATKTMKIAKFPAGHAVQDVSPDGKTLLTQTKVWGSNEVRYSTFIIPLDTSKPKLVGDEDDGFDSARFSPDGTKILGTRIRFTKSKEIGLFIHHLERSTDVRVPVSDEIVEGFNGQAVWSPDGKRLGVMWEATGFAGGPAGGGDIFGRRAKRITVMDVSGANAKTIHEFQPNESILNIEWARPRLGELPPAKPTGEGKRIGRIN
jgi:RNA polymerase sigma factor (sigma-70 family)